MRVKVERSLLPHVLVHHIIVYVMSQDKCYVIS